MIYPPSEDSELLLEATLKEVNPEDEVLEVGVGSGFVSERIKDKCSFLLATDINPFAVKLVREKGIDVIRTDLFEGIRKKFSLILFNPPYLELEDREKRGDWIEKAINGGKKGIEVICRFLDKVREVLSENGRIILIVSSFNTPWVFKEIEKRKFNWEIVGEKKLFFEKLYALKLTAARESHQPD